MPSMAVPVHLLLGQPGSGKDSRLALIAEETGADAFRFGAIFDRYASAMPTPPGIAERTVFFANYEVAGTLVDDSELLRRLASAGHLAALGDEQQVWAFKIAYYGGFKTGLVPDDVVNAIFTRELTAHLRATRPESIVLNSYPKTVSQYDHLQRQLFGHVVALPLIEGVAFHMEHTAWDALEDRMARRLVCNSCDSVYAAGEVQVAPDGGYTRACGNALRRRLDADIFGKRKKAYLDHTAPMIAKIRREWRSHTTLTGRAHFDSALGRSEIQTALSAWRHNT